jgi:hypothetical protein
MYIKTPIVFVSAYVEAPDGAFHYVDTDEGPEGWVVEYRVPTPAGGTGPFDCQLQETYPNPTIAMKNARDLATEKSCNLVEN